MCMCIGILKPQQQILRDEILVTLWSPVPRQWNNSINKSKLVSGSEGWQVKNLSFVQQPSHFFHEQLGWEPNRSWWKTENQGLTVSWCSRELSSFVCLEYIHISDPSHHQELSLTHSNTFSDYQYHVMCAAHGYHVIQPCYSWNSPKRKENTCPYILTQKFAAALSVKNYNSISINRWIDE